MWGISYFARKLHPISIASSTLNFRTFLQENIAFIPKFGHLVTPRAMARASAAFRSGINYGAQTDINEGVINNNFYNDIESVNVHARFKLSDYEGQKNANPDRVEGTCRWFLQHDRYRSWRDSATNDLLWVSGDPGCGKSVLSKFLVEHELSTLGPVSICYFFFKDDDEQRRLQNAPCGLLHQLFTLKPALLKHASRELERNGDRLLIEPLLLWRLLVTAATDPEAGHVICVLDALDECEDRDRYALIDFLKTFYNESDINSGRKTNVKVLVTSRPYHKIERRFQELISKVPTIRLAGEEECKAISEEIEIVIRSRVAKIGTERSLKPHVRHFLVTKLLNIPHQTYLWVHLIFEEIWETFDCTGIKLSGVIERLPESVDDAYERILSRSTCESEARKILQIVIAATRPLSLKEMDVILGMNDNTRQYNDLDLEGEIHIKHRIRNTCGLFLRVSDAKVYLIHQTAKEFLLAKELSDEQQKPRRGSKHWKNSFLEQDCDYVLAHTCVRYLSLSTFESGSFISYVMDRIGKGECKKQYLELLMCRYHFLEYSASQWGAHVRRLQLSNEDEIIQLSLSLCDSRSRRCEVWSTIYYDHKQLKFGSVAKYTSLHLACLIGIPQVVRKLLDMLLDGGGEINIRNRGIENPLQIAAAAGHQTIVQLLLTERADVDARDGKSGTALQLASEYGHEKIVQVLLGSGAKIDLGGSEYDNALHAASASGQESVVQLLLEQGADVNAQAGKYGTVLQVASFNNHYNIVEVLLRKGANVDTQGGLYGNALRAASSRGHEKVVQLLLDNGAKVNTQGGYYGNALQAASSGGHEKVVQLLLDNGAKVNTQGGYYGNALQAASSRGHEKVVQLLLDNGAKVNTQGGPYDNALQAASSSGHEKVVQLLLDNGATR